MDGTRCAHYLIWYKIQLLYLNLFRPNLDVTFWIRFQRLRVLRIASCWQLIQNLAPSTIVWRQCDIQIAKQRHILQKIFLKNHSFYLASGFQKIFLRFAFYYSTPIPWITSILVLGKIMIRDILYWLLTQTISTYEYIIS